MNNTKPSILEKIIFSHVSYNFPNSSREKVLTSSKYILNTINHSTFITKTGIKILLFMSTVFVPLHLVTKRSLLRFIPLFSSLERFLRLFGLMAIKESRRDINREIKTINSVEDILKEGSMEFTDIEKIYDIVIVGSGPSGAMMAYELSKKSTEETSILLIEEGRNCNKEILSKSISERILEMYRHGGLYPVYGSPLLALGVGATLGGGSKVNGGLFWRTPNFVLKEWRDNKILSQKFLSRLKKNFSYIEKIMDVETEKSISGYDQDSLILKNLSEKNNIDVVLARRALKDCQKNNECPAGCPAFAKQSVDLNLIPHSILSGVKILTSTKVDSIDHKNNSIFLKTKHSDKKVYYKNLFLNCGATETPKLLKRSKILKEKKFELDLHLNVRTVAEFPQELNSYRGTMFTHQVQEFIEKGYLIMPSNFNEYFFAASIAGFKNSEIDYLFRKYNHLALFILQVRIKSKAKLIRTGLNSYDYFFSLNDSDETLIKQGLYEMSTLLFSEKAKSIYLPTSSKHYKIEEGNKDAINDLDIKSLQLASVHQMASVPMGKYVTEEGELIGYPNIYISDSSVLPTNIGESPQLTIMSFAKNVADSFSFDNLSK